MKRSILAIFIVLFVTASYSSASAADYKTAQVMVNGTVISQRGIITGNRTLVPVRGVFEWLDYSIDWNSRTKTAQLYGDDFVIEIQSGLNYFTCLNSKTKTYTKITPDVPQQIIDGRFYIPLRAVSEAIGAEVYWNAAEYRAEITTEHTYTIQSQSSAVETKDTYPYEENEKYINLDNFKSSYIRDYINSKNYEFEYELKGIRKMELPSEALKSETIEDFNLLINLSDVEFNGDTIEDFSILTDFFKENPDSKISFQLPGEKKAITASNIDEYTDYYSLKKDIISRIISKSDSDFEKVLAIHDYMVLNTDYDYYAYQRNKIPKEDSDPYYVLMNHKAVCEGYTQASMALLSMVGIESQYISGTANGVLGWDRHAWLIVKIDGKYYHMDVTWDDPVEMPSDYIEWDSFLKSDSTMSEDHKWDTSEYPRCYSDYDYTPPYDYFDIHSEYFDDDYFYDDYEYYTDNDSDNSYNYTEDNTNINAENKDNAESDSDDNQIIGEDFENSYETDTETETAEE